MNKKIGVLFNCCVCLLFMFVFLSCEEEKVAIQAEEGTAIESADKENQDKKGELSASNEKTVSPESEKELPPPTSKEIGYAYGVVLAKAVKMNHLELDAKAVYKGYIDSINKENLDIATQEVILKRAFAEGKKRYAKENLAKEEAFLEKNKSAENVKTLESGLQYKVLKKGDEKSETPAKDATVKIVYSGKFLDSEKEFDSSQGEAVELSLNQTIEGWREIVPMMHIGDEFEVYIPSKLGYGEEGISYGGQEIIPPSTLLIFTLELKEIMPKETKDNEDKT